MWKKSQVSESKGKKVVAMPLANLVISPAVIKGLTRDDVIVLLKKRQGKRTARELAAELGISAPHLCEIYLGRRNPGPSVLSKLNLQERTVYEKVL